MGPSIPIARAERTLGRARPRVRRRSERLRAFPTSGEFQRVRRGAATRSLRSIAALHRKQERPRALDRRRERARTTDRRRGRPRRDDRALALAELEARASAALAVLLALLAARVAREEAGIAELGTERLVALGESARESVADRVGLPLRAAAVDDRDHVVLLEPLDRAG